MSYILLAILFLLSGFFMKYSDDLYDVNHDLKLASLFGVICAITSAAATVYNAGAAYIFISILIGNLLVLKVDGLHHIITLVLFIIISLAFGIPELSLVVLLICILASMGDEVGHELVSDYTDNKFLNFFFEYRFVMKIVTLLLAIAGAFSIWIFVCFMLFDVFYVIGGIVFEKFN